MTHDRFPPMKTIITGTGIGIPKNGVRNDALAKIMDTSDEWIRTRSGIEQRHYADPGEGSAELGMLAAQNALASANRTTADIDAVIFATMTPNYFFPGNGPVLQAKMGFPNIPTFDIRQQCSGFLYGLDLADSLIRSGKYAALLLVGAEVHTPVISVRRSGKYRRLLLVGAEVHTPFMPEHRGGWASTIGEEIEITDEMRALSSLLRDRTGLFGDGA